MTSGPFLSVVIPAYNEAGNFKHGTLEGAYTFLKAQDYRFELLIIDDGSTDETLQLLTEFAINKPEVRVIRAKHRGKGPTVAQGLQQALGQNRLFCDFDQSTPLSELSALLEARAQGYDIVIGSREIYGAKRQQEPYLRHIMGKGFNTIVRLLTVQGIHDTQCGFKLLSDQAVRVIVPKLKITTSPKKDAFTGAFDVELLFLALKYGFTIKEVPVAWTHVASARVSPVKDSGRMFMEVLKIRLADIRGEYVKA